jgi:hypothetical protein
MVRHIHIDSLQEYISTKFAQNSDNSLYFTGGSSEILIGTPDVRYTDIAFIKPTGQIITHGRVYSCNELTFDTEPTEGSQNPVTSDGILTALENLGVVWTELV